MPEGQTVADPPDTPADKQPAQEGGGAAVAVSANTIVLDQICLDFRLREDRFRRDFEEFLNRHLRQLALDPEGDVIEEYLQRVWPNGLPGTLIVANISRQTHPLWQIRPPATGPLAARLAAGNLAPAFRVYRRRGVLTVTGFDIVPHVPVRPFETQVAGTIHLNSPAVIISSADLATLEGLPRHRQELLAHLDRWRSYLDWRETLALFDRTALPYESVERNDDDTLRFVLTGRHDARQLGQRLNRQPLLAAPADASRQPDRWDPEPQARPTMTRVGTVKQVEPLDSGVASGQQAGRRAPNTSRRQVEPTRVAVTLVLDDGERLGQRESLTPQGFLLSEVGGDLKPVAGERAAIGRLASGRGHLPHLAECLLAVEHAAQPAVIPELCHDEPSLRALNPDQQAAINKAMAAPEICLIQGPPGTGKTEVIAGICRLTIEAGERVLIASQANPAVDNALARLDHHPIIRPLRIGRPERIDQLSHRFLENGAARDWLDRVRRGCLARLRRIDLDQRKLRQLDRGLKGLGNVLEQAEAIAGQIRQLRDGLGDLKDQRQQTADQIGQVQTHVAQADRRRRGLEDLRRWLQWPTETWPAVEILAETPLAETIRGAVSLLVEQLLALPWPVPSVTAPAGSVGPGIFAHALQAVGAVKPLRSAVEQALSLCHGANVATDTADARQLQALQAERRGLLESECEEDLVRVAAINRRINALRQDRWGTLCRDMLVPLQAIFGEAMPDQLAELTESLQPESRWTTTLESLLELSAQLDGPVRKQLESILENLREQTDTANAALVARVAELRDELGTGEQALAQAQAAVEETEDQVARLVQRLEDCSQRWQRLWPTVCIDQPDEAANVPALTAASLQARQTALSAWRDAEAERHHRDRQWQGILQEFAERLEDPPARHDLDDLYVRHANAVGLTCYEAGRRELHGSGQFEPYDVVIIDEASKTTPPELLMPALLGRRLILVGDHRQLPPMFRQHEQTFEEAAEDGLVEAGDFERYRAMVTSSFFGSLYARAPETLRHGLWTQYRMHPQIMAAVNHFYDGRLLAGPSQEVLDQGRQHRLRIPDGQGGWLLEPHQHLLWVDSTRTASGRYWYEQQRGTSKVNLLEVDLIAAMLVRLGQALTERGYSGHHQATVAESLAGLPIGEALMQILSGLPPQTVDDLLARGRVQINGQRATAGHLVRSGDAIAVDARKDVGVISFYGAQLGQIRRQIERIRKAEPEALAAMDLRSQTVDRFQGMEQSVILISLVRARRHIAGGQHVRAYQRINVAISRARELLVVVGNQQTFRNLSVDLPPVDGGQTRPLEVYRQLQQLVTQFGGRRYAKQLL